MTKKKIEREHKWIKIEIENNLTKILNPYFVRRNKGNFNRWDNRLNRKKQ